MIVAGMLGYVFGSKLIVVSSDTENIKTSTNYKIVSKAVKDFEKLGSIDSQPISIRVSDNIPAKDDMAIWKLNERLDYESISFGCSWKRSPTRWSLFVYINSDKDTVKSFGNEYETMFSKGTLYCLGRMINEKHASRSFNERMMKLIEENLRNGDYAGVVNVETKL